MRSAAYSSLPNVASRGYHLVHRGIVDTTSFCGHGEVKHKLQVREYENKLYVCTRARLRLVCGALRMRIIKSDSENWFGQNRTSRTACYGHVQLSNQRPLVEKPMLANAQPWHVPHSLASQLGFTTVVSTLGSSSQTNTQVSNMGVVQPSRKRRIIIDSDSDSEED